MKYLPQTRAANRVIGFKVKFTNKKCTETWQRVAVSMTNLMHAEHHVHSPAPGAKATLGFRKRVGNFDVGVEPGS